VPQDPEAIQREIERTRSELAHTLDAIADRVSPKRAASRSAHKVKSKVENVFRTPVEPDGFREISEVHEAEPADYVGYSGTTAGYESRAFAGQSEYETQVRVRYDRILIVAGVTAAVITSVVLLRRRKR